MVPMEKYHFHVATRVDGTPYKVIAISTYAGKRVRGVAKCDPQDTFNIEKGKELAAARCAVRIAQKRLNRADRKAEEAYVAYEQAEKHYEDMRDYVMSADAGLCEAEYNLNKILTNL